MTADAVLRFAKVAPFMPFEMLLADGRAVSIPHPDFISVTESEEMVYLYDTADGIETIDLMLVVSLRVPIRTPAVSATR